MRHTAPNVQPSVAAIAGFRRSGDQSAGLAALARSQAAARIASVLWSSPLWTPLAPAWAPWVVGLLTPAIAGAATWNGDERSRWRPVVIAAMGVLTLAALAFVLFVPE